MADFGLDSVGKSNPEKIFEKIQRSLDYESGYHAQSMEAYNIYSNVFHLIKGTMKGTDWGAQLDLYMQNSRRSNVYYANIETLKGLVLPQIPSLVLTLNASKKVNNNKYDKEFYSVLANIFQTLVKNTIDNMEPNVFDAFKLDYLVSGRGVLWATVEEDESTDERTPRIEHVRWQDFCMDTKPLWKTVSWVARRLLFTPKQFCKRFNTDESNISSNLMIENVYADIAIFDSFGDRSPYVEVWEYWDKPTLTRYFVSKQFKHDAEGESRFLIEKTKYEDADEDFFLPTPEPPMLMYNGINLIPYSDVWNYINELKELSNITYVRADLIKNLHLRGYTDVTKANIINEISNSLDRSHGISEDSDIVGIPGFTPTENEQLIYYVDNKPRLEMLDILQKEYQFLQQRIYSLTGISEQMRNVTNSQQEDDETATSIRLRSKFGSRRLKEHQQRLLNYWVATLKILLRRICQTYTKEDLKEIFSYSFRDSNKDDVQQLIFERESVFQELTSSQNTPQPMELQNEQPQQQIPQDFQGQQGGEQMESPQPQQQQPDVQQPQEQGQVPPALQQQGQQQQDPGKDLNDRLNKLSDDYEQLMGEVTWERIIDFFRNDKLVSFLVTCKLDDLENKIISDEKKNSDLEFMNMTINIVNQIIANVNNNPKFADIYTSIFSLSLDNFDQTKAQRDSIDEFIKQIKEYSDDMVENPQPKQPSPEDQKKLAEAEEAKAKVGLIQAQIQEIQAKIQAMQAPMPDESGQVQQMQQGKMAELNLKHSHDMELQQAKIAAEQQKYREKMESDEALVQAKIAADKERYAEKLQSDFVKTNVKPEGK